MMTINQMEYFLELKEIIGWIKRIIRDSLGKIPKVNSITRNQSILDTGLKMKENIVWIERMAQFQKILNKYLRGVKILKEFSDVNKWDIWKNLNVLIVMEKRRKNGYIIIYNKLYLIK